MRARITAALAATVLSVVTLSGAGSAVLAGDDLRPASEVWLHAGKVGGLLGGGGGAAGN